MRGHTSVLLVDEAIAAAGFMVLIVAVRRETVA